MTANDSIDVDRGPALAEAVIRDFYEILLQQQPRAAELEKWAGALLSGMVIRDVRKALLNREECRRQEECQALTQFVSDSGIFDPDWYLATYPDVAEAQLDALTHYCNYGMHEGRMPNGFLAPFWYRERVGLAEIDDVFPHYVAIGEPDRIPPGPDFDPIWYRRIQELPDDAPALAHFLTHRREDWVAPCARLWSVRGLPIGKAAEPFCGFLQTEASADAAILRAAGVFDENFYAIQSNDVLDNNIDLLEHFCLFGWREGRNPNFYFQIRWYLETNPEVAVLGVNPLVHYLLRGEPAGRRPTVYFDPDWYRSTYGPEVAGSALAHYLANRRTQKFAPNALFDPAWYASQDHVRLGPNRDPFPHFLSVGMTRDVSPGAAFDMALWRRRLRGRASRHFTDRQSPERDNPLLLYLASHYT